MECLVRCKRCKHIWKADVSALLRICPVCKKDMWFWSITRAEDICRFEANNLMRKLSPETKWHTHMVHHKDRNPCNNKIENLQIMLRAEHTRLHCTRIKRTRWGSNNASNN